MQGTKKVSFTACLPFRQAVIIGMYQLKSHFNETKKKILITVVL